MTPYDDAARPERHPALATRLPVSTGRVLLASCTVLVVFGGAIGLAVSGWAVATFGVETTMWVCAALCLTSALGLLDPQVRGLRAAPAAA